MRGHLVLILLLLYKVSLSAQTVGLVFSGGGSKGLAHIGVLKALEENNIPVDYITGTSMGAIVGGMYASGYSPEEIEKIALSKDFQDWVNGRFESDYKFYFKKKPDNPGLFSTRLKIDKEFHASFRSGLVNDIPLNFALLELFGQASANAKDNFNNLFVPFRCVVADVFSQKTISVKEGSLVEAIRGTMTVPFLFRPVKVDGEYVFDGGLYNNFPVDIMQKEFNPAYIIGANVSSKVFNEYPKDNDEKLVNRFLWYVLLAKSDSTMMGKNGVYIQPDLAEYNSANFSPVEELIKKGYDATIADMPKIKRIISRRVSRQNLTLKREKFRKNDNLTFTNMKVSGIDDYKAKYITGVFRQDSGNIRIKDIRKGYYKLVADDNFETVYPRMIYQPRSGLYNFELLVRPQTNFKIDVGGNISTRPISNIYLGLQYNYLSSKSYTVSANFYSGRFYESVQNTARMDVPTRIPFYVEGELTYNHWNYFNTSKITVENVDPIFIEQYDRRLILKTGIPLSKNGKLEGYAGFLNFKDRFSPNDRFTTGDILDISQFAGVTAGLAIDKNTLNLRQYADHGLSFHLGFSYFKGAEEYTPGNIFRNEPFFGQLKQVEHNRSWIRFKLSSEHYIVHKKAYSLGLLIESEISTKPPFSTYKSTVLSAPAFFPLQDSRSLFLEKFRASTYGALGIKNVFNLRKNLDLRLEGYLFQPLEAFKLKNYQSTDYDALLSGLRTASTAGLVYHSPVGPVSLSFNQYDDDKKRYGIMFHIGYLIYNKRAFE